MVHLEFNFLGYCLDSNGNPRSEDCLVGGGSCSPEENANTRHV